MSPPATFPTLASGHWRLDPDGASVRFVTRTLWGAIPVRGSFAEYHGSLDLSADPAIRLVVAAASLSTKNAKRDAHLRSDDFFAADAHPEVVFESSEVSLHDDHLHVRGTLSAAGRSITVEPQTHVRAIDGGIEIDAVARVPHRDLGMTANPGGMIPAKSWLYVTGRLVPA